MAVYEGKFRQDTTRALREHASLVVSTVEGGGLGGTPGLPDVYYAGTLKDDVQKLPGLAGVYLDGWIELKVLVLSKMSKAALRGDVPVHGECLRHFTAQQRVWLRKHSSRGGRCHLYLLVLSEDVRWYYLFEGGLAAERLGVEDGGLLYRDFERHCRLGRDYNHKKEPDGYALARALHGPAPAPRVESTVRTP